MIWEHSPSIFQSLARTSHTLCSYYPSLIHKRPQSSSPEVFHPLKDFSRISRICIKVMYILGEYCITEISTDPQGSQHELEVSDKLVSGVQVAYGSYGLTALRILYEDDSKSPWLGEKCSLNPWFKTCRGRLQDIQTRFDVWPIVLDAVPSMRLLLTAVSHRATKSLE